VRCKEGDVVDTPPILQTRQYYYYIYYKWKQYYYYIHNSKPPIDFGILSLTLALFIVILKLIERIELYSIKGLCRYKRG
jgi:hypothetical protein